MTEREPCPGCGDLGYTVEGGYRCCGGSEWECGARGCTGPIIEEQQVECPCGISRDGTKGEGENGAETAPESGANA